MGRPTLVVHHVIRALVLPRCAICVFALGVVACSAQKSPSSIQRATPLSSSTAWALYVGPPGTPPPGATLSGEVGVYTFASLDNYCHMARWLVSGTLAPAYQNEARPVLIARNTPVEILHLDEARCTYRGQSIEIKNRPLAKVRILAGVHRSEVRYVTDDVVYTQGAYDDYAKREAANRK
jgi:hypothetical protein